MLLKNEKKERSKVADKLERSHRYIVDTFTSFLETATT